MPAARAKALQLQRLLDAIYQHYHHDFRGYARSSLLRRVELAQTALACAGIDRLRERVLDEPAAFDELLRHLTIQVSELFRDPPYYLGLRDRVLPMLATFPAIKVWVAGCGTGEEAYSIAILLAEAGLLGRSLIYATDIDAASLRIAESGCYPLARLPTFNANYERGGGRAALADHLATAGGRIVMDPGFRPHLLFADHSLATDAAFAEVQLISCRNVLIYFDLDLQNRALALCRDSLCSRGFLGLGSSESLNTSVHANAFEEVAEAERIYRKRRVSS